MRSHFQMIWHNETEPGTVVCAHRREGQVCAEKVMGVGGQDSRAGHVEQLSRVPRDDFALRFQLRGVI